MTHAAATTIPEYGVRSDNSTLAEKDLREASCHSLLIICDIVIMLVSDE